MPLADTITPEPYRAPTMEEVQRARLMYVEKFIVARICAACDMSLGALYDWRDGGPLQEDGTRLLPPLPRRLKTPWAIPLGAGWRWQCGGLECRPAPRNSSW